ncbi:unnamed protein product [Mytilus edulis]|uniref:B box-type domain-containing protein n=1 Tax=Mytilus edulis TaxID=6550 RepID=A0A8S3RXZ5_MYTED|nr:unnamed protein product [Mytilus edulis]
MASSVKPLCTICHDNRNSNRAVRWCTECEVLFCEDCEKPHKIEKTTSETARYIEDLKREDHFIEKSLEVNISSALQSVVRDVKSFGDIAINTTSSTLQIKAGRKDQAQNFISKVPGIEEIKPSLFTKLTIPNDMQTLNISACRILPNGNFIILDFFKKQLLLFSNDGIFIRIVVTFTQYPIDVGFIRDNTVAVTFVSVKQAKLVDIQQNKIIQTIKVSHNFYGVASDSETLVISGDRQCTRLNLNDMSHTILEGMEGVGRISLFHGNIYGTIPLKTKVCCFKSTGEPLWTFTHKDIDSPVGMSLDMNGFVYIVSRGNNGVLVVSPDGKTCKTILSEADGINRSWAIDIHKETGMMIVPCQKGKIVQIMKQLLCTRFKI